MRRRRICKSRRQLYDPQQQHPLLLFPHTQDITAIMTIAQRIVQRSIPQIDGLQHDSFWQHSITERLLSHFVMYTMTGQPHLRLSSPKIILLLKKGPLINIGFCIYVIQEIDSFPISCRGRYYLPASPPR